MSTILQNLAAASIEVIIFGFALGLVYRVWGGVFRLPKRHTVQPFQSGVVMRGQTADRVLPAGRHWIWPKETLFLCDMRCKPFQFAGLEALSSDQMVFRISINGEYQVSSPVAFVSANSDAFGAFYLDIRQAIYSGLREQHSSSLSRTHTAIAEQITALVANRSAQLGVGLQKLDVYELMPLGRVQISLESESIELPIQ